MLDFGKVVLHIQYQTTWTNESPVHRWIAGSEALFVFLTSIISSLVLSGLSFRSFALRCVLDLLTKDHFTVFVMKPTIVVLSALNLQVGTQSQEVEAKNTALRNAVLRATVKRHTGYLQLRHNGSAVMHVGHMLSGLSGLCNVISSVTLENTTLSYLFI